LYAPNLFSILPFFLKKIWDINPTNLILLYFYHCFIVLVKRCKYKHWTFYFKNYMYSPHMGTQTSFMCVIHSLLLSLVEKWNSPKIDFNLSTQSILEAF
jgi:hypothetical protein